MSDLIPVLIVSREGDIAPTPVPGSSDMLLPGNDGNIVLAIRNGSGSTETVTVTPTAEAAGQALAPTVVSVPAGETWYAGPWPPVIFNDDQDNVAVAASSTDLSVSALGL